MYMFRTGYPVYNNIEYLGSKSLNVGKGWCSVRTVSSVAQSCPSLCDPMKCSPPGSSVYGIIQARILEWVAISSSRGSTWPRDWTCVSCGFLHWQVGSLPLSHLRSHTSHQFLHCPKTSCSSHLTRSFLLNHCISLEIWACLISLLSSLRKHLAYCQTFH